MAGFNPDQFLQETSGSGFDPDKFLSSTKPVPTKESSPAVSAVRKFVQGGTAGFSDEAAGAVEAVGKAMGVDGLGGPMKDVHLSKDGPTSDFAVLKDAYIKARDKERAALKSDEEQNPKTSAVAEFAGGIMSPVNKVAPNASIATQGAIYGGLSGAGNSESDNALDLTKDTAKGAALGYGIGKAADVAAPLLQKGVQKVGEKVGDIAEKFAAKAVGAERASVKKMGADRATEVGRYALDNSLLGHFSNAEDIQAANNAIKASAADKMNQVYTAIDNANASTFNPKNVADEIEQKLGGFYRSPINKGETAQLENTLESIRMRGDQNIPLAQAQDLKEELGKVANWKNNLNITEKERMAREAYSIVNQHIDDAAQVGAKTIGQPGIEETLAEGKKLYSLGKSADEFLKNKAARESGNQLFGLKSAVGSTTGATIGASAGGPIGAAAGSLIGATATKAADKYGAQNAALALDKVSSALMKVPDFAVVAKNNPNAFKAMVESVVPHFESASGAASALPAAADKDTPKKGPDKWANDGIKSIQSHDPEFLNKDLIEKLKSSPSGQSLLIDASSAKPGSKKMDNIVQKIRTSYLNGGQ